MLVFSVSTVVILSWFLRITVMTSLDGVGCMFEIASRVPEFVVFWRIAHPHGSILELVVVELRVDDFVEFVFVFFLYLNSRRRFSDL